MVAGYVPGNTKKPGEVENNKDPSWLSVVVCVLITNSRNEK
jgi:hypothetical protein